jgi:magnesium transporter
VVRDGIALRLSEHPGEDAMQVLWITEDGAEALPLDRVDEVHGRDDGVLWVDIDHDDEDGLALLKRLVAVRPLDLDECHSRTPVPKMRPYSDHIFAAINGLARGTNGRLYFQPLKSFLMQRTLFTVLGPTSSHLTAEVAHGPLTTLRQRIEAGEFRPHTGFELISVIRYGMMQAHETLVMSVAGQIADLEQSVMHRDPVRAELLLDDLFGLRHDLQTIRTNAAQTHELYVHVIEQMERQAGLMPLDLNLFHELRRGWAHLQNSTDLEREYLQEVLDLFQTRVSTELNRFVRKITAFGTIAIGWTVITGIYGMNFTGMPELTWKYGYFYALGLMVLIGGVSGVFFRRRGWL